MILPITITIFEMIIRGRTRGMWNNIPDTTYIIKEMPPAMSRIPPIFTGAVIKSPCLHYVTKFSNPDNECSKCYMNIVSYQSIKRKIDIIIKEQKRIWNYQINGSWHSDSISSYVVNLDGSIPGNERRTKPGQIICSILWNVRCPGITIRVTKWFMVCISWYLACVPVI